MTNVVVIILDSLRADAVSYDPDGPTPHIAALAKDGLRFSRAIAPAAWTLPSHTSMLTGLHPSQHRIQARGSAKEAMVAARADLAELARKEMLLPKMLEDAGVNTFLGSTNVWVSELSGFGRWFSTVSYVPFPPRREKPKQSGSGSEAQGQRKGGGPRQQEPPRLPPRLRQVVPLPVKHVGKYVAENLIRVRNSIRQARPIAKWALARRDKGGAEVASTFDSWLTPDEAPFFALFNLIETHGPHLGTKGWGPFDVRAVAATLRHPGQTWARRMNLHNWGYKPLKKGALETLVRSYEAEVRYADHLVGQLVATLERAGLREQTMVVVAGDHGEAFGESGLVGHGLSLGEPVARVPLVIAGPGVEKDVVEAPVGLTSIASTVAEAMLVDGTRFPGGSLLSDEGRGQAQIEVESPWLHFHPGAGWKVRTPPPGMDRPAAAFYHDRFKLIVGSFWGEALFDLDSDPDEQDNLMGRMEVPEALQQMRTDWESRVEDASKT